MKSKYWVVLVVVVLAMTTLACSLGGAAQVPEAAATVKAVATEVKSVAGTPAPGGGGGDGPLSLRDRQAGLDKLKSYRMKWQAQWKATETGSTESLGWDWVEEYSSSPQALHWTWRMTASQEGSKGLDMEAWQIGNTMYWQTKEQGKAQCMSFSSDDQKNQLSKGLFNPSMLGSVENAKYVGTETVNGIKARHYKYDEKAMALFATGKVSGDIWVAIDGGYVVKETVNWSGVAGLFGAGAKSKGDGTWTWELSDVNQSITIKAPEGCGGAAADIPVMKDATDKTTLGDTIIYKSATKLADVVEFYKSQMPKAGWQLQGEPEVSEEFASMEFTKGDQTAKVALSIADGKTQVMITVEK